MSVAVFFPAALPFAKKLGLQVIPQRVLDFFVDNTKEIIKLRTESDVVSNAYSLTIKKD
jgi:hypothetical protein